MSIAATIAATRNAERAVIECLDVDGCVVGYYNGDNLVAFLSVTGPVSPASIVSALPGSGWTQNAECDEWLQWARSQVG